MNRGFSLTLILPAFNEARVIRHTVEEARNYFDTRNIDYEIIVAADGDDGTREIVRDMAKSDPRLKVIGSAERRGKGNGIREAIVLASGNIIGFSDADNKTPIDEFDKVLLLLQSGHQVVIGSRASKDSKIEKPQPLYRRIGSRGFNLFMKAITGLYGIEDTQCGFKFFQRNVALELFSRQSIDGYMFDVEILYLARKLGYNIGQVPVRWRDDGDSRLMLLSGNIRNVIDIFKIRLGVTSKKAINPKYKVAKTQK